MVNIDIIEDKVVVKFKHPKIRSTGFEMGLVTEDLKVERPVRNLTDTLLDDLMSEIKDIETIDPGKYKEVIEYITTARFLNNIAKTIEESVNMEMIGLFYTLASIPLSERKK